MAAIDPTEPRQTRYRSQRPLVFVGAACGLLALFALIGLATSAESVEEYEERQQASSGDLNGDVSGDRDQADPSQERPEGRKPAQPAENDSSDQPSGQTLDRSDQPGRLVPGDNGRYFYPDDNGPVEGLRVTEDGRLEPVELGDLGPGDLPLSNSGAGGLSIIDPQTGTRIELINDGDNVSGRSSAPGGGYASLVTTDDGSVVAIPADAFTPEQLAGADGDPVVFNPANGPISVAFTEDGLVAEPLPEDAVIINDLLDRVFAGSQSLPWRWVFLAYAALATVSILGGLILHWRRPRHQLDLGPFSAEPEQVDRFERLLLNLAAEPDPTHAVCAAFAVAERGLGRLAPRRAQETPSEWYHRLLTETDGSQSRVGRNGPTPEVAQRLGPVCDLYARARFAPGASTAADQQAMIAALRDLHASATGHASTAAPIFHPPMAGATQGSAD